MSNILHTIFKGKETKQIVVNFISLIVLQFLNIVLPLLVVPYIIQNFGIVYMGRLNFAHAVALFFVIFVEYGFNTSTTKDIAVSADRKDIVEQIFSEVMTSKFAILSVIFVIYIGLVFMVPMFREHSTIHLFYFGIVIGHALFPVWLFQGLQKMKYITYINVIFKSFFTICIFLFVKKVEQLWMVPMFVSLGVICSGLSSLLVVYVSLGYRYQLPEKNRIWLQLKRGYHLFMSEFYMALMQYSNILLLRFFSGEASVGIYSTAEKIIRAASGLLSPLFQALYPYVAKIMNQSVSEGIAFVEKIRKYGLLIITTGLVAVFIFSEWFISLIYRDMDLVSMRDTVLTFRILIAFPLLSFLDQLYGKLILILTGNVRRFFQVFAFGAMLNLVLCSILSYYYHYIGAAVSSMVSQIVIVLGMYYFAKPILKQEYKKEHV